MVDEQIREGEPDPRARERDTADPRDADDASVPDIRRRPSVVRLLHVQMIALGVFWILVLGSLSGISAFLFGVTAGDFETEYFSSVLTMFALVWIMLGALVCMKHIWAVRVGLVLSYLTVIILIFSLFWGDTFAGWACLCTSVFLGLSILQAHRVIGWANKMHSAGIPLDRKPE